MTHVGQEEALGPVRRFRRFLRRGHLSLGAAAFGDIFHRQHEQLGVAALSQLPRVEQHHAASDDGKVVLELEVVED